MSQMSRHVLEAERATDQFTYTFFRFTITFVCHLVSTLPTLVLHCSSLKNSQFHFSCKAPCCFLLSHQMAVLYVCKLPLQQETRGLKPVYSVQMMAIGGFLVHQGCLCFSVAVTGMSRTAQSEARSRVRKHPLSSSSDVRSVTCPLT